MSMPETPIDKSPPQFLGLFTILGQALKTEAGSDPWQWSGEHLPAIVGHTSRPDFATTRHWPPSPAALAFQSPHSAGPCWAHVLG